MSAVTVFCANQKRIGSASVRGNANMLNMWFDFFVKHSRADLARAIVAAGDMTPALHAEWAALNKTDTRRNTRLSNITTY